MKVRQLLITLLGLLPLQLWANVNAYDLRCEALHQPMGICTAQPRLSWKMTGDHNGARQSAYQIQAASTPELLRQGKPDLWDTGRVESQQSQWVEWGGSPLASRSMVYWQVKVWDENGKESQYSGGAKFSVGILHSQEWEGRFIGYKPADPKAQPMLRTTFQCDDVQDVALLNLCTLGYHEVYLNGQRVGDDVLAPAMVEYRKRYLAMTYEVTPLLKEGRNDLVIWLGQGWYNAPWPTCIDGAPYVLAQLDQRHGAEWKTLAKTDASWQARQSGYYHDGNFAAQNFAGEVVKAAELLPALDAATLDGAEWGSAYEAPVPEREITPMMCEPNKVQIVINPVRVTRFRDNTWMVDMGRSVVGFTRIRFHGLRKGQRLQISYCDMLGLNGDFEYGVFSDYYFAGGAGEETFCNKFNYHAYRYIKISGLEEQPRLSDIEGMSVYTGYTGESAFVCNDPELNSIHDMVHYTLKCLTTSGYMVDCPHLERCGYGGDGNGSILTAQTMYDMYPLYRNWLQAYGDSQGDDGEVPHIAPVPWRCGGGPFWCAFIANAPWQTYMQYGDRQILERHYPHMQRYLQYAEKYMPNGLLSLENRWESTERKWWFLGDWALPNEEHQHHPESIDLVNSCSMSWVYGTMARVAAVLGKADDAQLYQRKQADINALIHRTFYDKKTKTYANGLQLDQAFPLLMGVTPESLREKTNGALRRLTYDRFDGHLFTGLVGIPILTQWLSKSGDVQLMYDMLKKRSFPGYLYMIENGATTTWEHWNARRSRIHNCYNGIGSWFYQALAGIWMDEEQVAYRHFTLRPQWCDGINFVRALQPTPYGPITVDWKRNAQTFDLTVEIPVGCTASVIAPEGAVSAEFPAVALMRYGLIYNENQRDKIDAPVPTRLDISRPIELQSGKYRLVFKLR